MAGSTAALAPMPRRFQSEKLYRPALIVVSRTAQPDLFPRALMHVSLSGPDPGSQPHTPSQALATPLPTTALRSPRAV
ncbi:hypothetical protein B7L68_07605 [Thermoproteus sp. CP80]|nr:hypothetical protein B7L68_07605 [Thermoproteus sp. CP80]